MSGEAFVDSIWPVTQIKSHDLHEMCIKCRLQFVLLNLMLSYLLSPSNVPPSVLLSRFP